MRCRSPSDRSPGLRLLVVGDLGLARDLYRDVLGLPVLRDGDRGLLLGAGRPLVPVLTLCGAEGLRTDGARSLLHALVAAQGGAWVQLGTTDVDATLERLRAYGADVLRAGSERADGSRAGAATDPWDNTLRLVQRRAMNPVDRARPTS